MGKNNTLLRLSTTMALAVVLSSSCAKRENALQQSATSPENTIEVAAAPALPRKAAIVTQDQILASMASILGTVPRTTASAATNTVGYDARKRTAFSLNGDASEITSGMWMSITALAGYVCEDLYADEMARAAGSRYFYASVNFTGNNNWSMIRDDIIDRMALGAWGRLLTGDERTAFNEALTSAGLSGATLTAAQTRQGLLMVCTGVMGSLAAHLR